MSFGWHPVADPLCVRSMATKPDKKQEFSQNLHLLLRTFKVGEAEFVDQYAATPGNKLRRNEIRLWLTGERAAYRDNLQQLVAFWRAWIPSLEGAHLSLPPEEFEKVLAGAIGASDTLNAVELNLYPAQLPLDVITTICGSYRVFRYDVREARIVSEALSISRRMEGNRSVLDAKLWSPTTRTPQEFEGTAIVLGDNVYIVLHDVNQSSAMMRFINMQMRPENARPVIFGTASGVFEMGGQSVAMVVALEKKSADPSVAASAAKRPVLDNDAWVLSNATGAVKADVVVMLQRPIHPTSS